jgi:signal transduction histidine kinase
MSLRVRLVLLILALVAIVAISLSALQLQTLVDSLSEESVDRVGSVADQVTSFLVEHISAHTPEYPPPADTEATKRLWSEIVATDPDTKLFLERNILTFTALIEINIADGSGTILASSNPPNVGTQLRPRESFVTWSQLPWYTRAYDLVTRRADWEVSPSPIGIEGSSDPVFRVQVLTSSVLLRDELFPNLQRLASVTGAAVLVALLLTVAVTHQALRPVRRIERTIDRIAQGGFQSGEPFKAGDGTGAKEFQIVESKLNLLGQQFHDVLESAHESPRTLDVMVERMATQLDVATRLAAISRLSGGVAHEIKNPLNAILLRLDLLRARLGDSGDDVTQELDVLSKEVLRLDRVVKTFLDFSRPVEVHFEDVDVAAVVREMAELIRPQASLFKVEIECDTPAEPALMRGDPDLLKQAVLNLVTNALEAMANGGKLRISVAPNEERWVLEVTDNGPGIPPDVRQKVFLLYFTTKSKGSGIGLAMTYRAVQLHNGTISFSTETGQGTTFRLEFPALVRHA